MWNLSFLQAVLAASTSILIPLGVGSVEWISSVLGDGVEDASVNSEWSVEANNGGEVLVKVKRTSVEDFEKTKGKKKYKGVGKVEVARVRQELVSPSLYTFYDTPVMLVRASKEYMFDEERNKYLDAYNNVCHIGHCHPKFTEQVSQQLCSINTNTRYLHPNLSVYITRLCDTLPKSLKVCYLVNSGSEANDLAIRLAQHYTKGYEVICMHGSYHGTTQLCTEVSGSMSTGVSKRSSEDMELEEEVGVMHRRSPCGRFVDIPDVYRGRYREDDPDAAAKYAAEVEQKILRVEQKGGKISAFLAESIMGVAGQVFYPDGYLERVYDTVRAHGGVCIADEVQTGFGRVGSHFWAFEAQNVVPDIVTMGKPIGNGFPLGAVITTKAIAQAFSEVKYFNTFGGNPVACAAGIAVLQAMKEDKLQDNARVVGAHLLEGLLRLKDSYECVGDVRGKGLFIGVEIVQSKSTREPDAESCSILFNLCRHLGLLLGTGGVYGNVLRIKGPLCITLKHADDLLSIFERALQLLPEELHRKHEQQNVLNSGIENSVAASSSTTNPPPSSSTVV